MPHELSGGQQQRVALARALGPEPRLILLDEPFSNLDPSIRARVRSEVRQLIRSVGITAIFVTHDQDDALSVADQVAVMNEGKILQVGTPREIYTAPTSRAVAGFIGQPNFLPGEVVDGHARCELGSFPVAAHFSGPADVMIRPEDLHRCENGVTAEVVASSYLGHEQQLTLRLPSGALVKSRWRANELFVEGTVLAIQVRGDVHAFPAS